MSASSQMPASPTSATAAPPVPATATTLSALKTGARYAQPRPPGSGDAWLLADLARQAGGPLVILTAEPLEAQRLAEKSAVRAQPVGAPAARLGNVAV